MDSNASVQQRKRRRPALACEQCRRRKIKCDRETPCDQCTRSKSELCTYIPDERHNAHSGTRRASLGRSLASRSASPPMGSNSPSHTEILPVNGMFDSRANQASSTRNSMKSKEVHTRGQGLDATSGLEQRLNDRMKLLEQKILDVGNLRSGESTAVSSWKRSARPSPTPPMRGIFSKTRLFGQSHWMNSAQQVRGFPIIVFKLNSATRKMLEGAIGALPLYIEAAILVFECIEDATCSPKITN